MEIHLQLIRAILILGVVATNRIRMLNEPGEITADPPYCNSRAGIVPLCEGYGKKFRVIKKYCKR